MAKGGDLAGMDRTLLGAGERVGVAVSGGADSVALLLALVEANTAGAGNKEPLGVVLRVVHVHHGLRGAEADGDADFVRALAERLGLAVDVVRVDTAERQAAEREGMEEAARELRYGVFRERMAAGAMDVVATAHTLDDQAETVMIKLLRGAWTEGLGGISPVVEDVSKRGRVVRPLLGVRRAEVEAFLRARGQAWREDASNGDLALTRNRVRHALMPLLRSFNPAVDEALARTAEIARDEEAFWAGELARTLPLLLLPGKPVRGGGRAAGTAGAVALEVERVRAMAPALRRRVLRAAVRAVGCAAGAEETAKLLALAGLGGHAGVTGRVGSRLELRGGLRAERSARELRLWRAEAGH